ncbi:MAG TPA: response regulator transcription factor [Roseiflexaceae bacterium]|nr:response regulator transcription factor [Roseiflexaceae bacterium]
MINQRQAGDERNEPAISVVLVDRHAMVREGLCRILTAEPGIDVVVSTGAAQEAIDLMASFQPNVCILDADVPQVKEIMGRIAADAPTVAVLILAADEDIQQGVALVRAGARGNLCKHADGRDLIRTVHGISRGELLLSTQILQAVISQLAQHHPGGLGADELPHEVVSARELEVLGLLCQGRTDKEIAQTLYLSVRTVNSHVSHIYAKLGVSTRTEAMHAALERGLVTLTTAAPTPPISRITDRE